MEEVVLLLEVQENIKFGNTSVVCCCVTLGAGWLIIPHTVLGYASAGNTEGNEVLFAANSDTDRKSSIPLSSDLNFR